MSFFSSRFFSFRASVTSAPPFCCRKSASTTALRTSMFASEWKDAHNGQSLIFQMSFGGSTTQAQNIVNGFPADVFAASTATDVELVQKAGLITHDWKQDQDGSIVASSVVGFMVRPGNPKGIHNWNDLTKPGIQILTPDPQQSGQQPKTNGVI